MTAFAIVLHISNLLDKLVSLHGRISMASNSIICEAQKAIPT